MGDVDQNRSQIVIELKNLTKRFHSTIALREVNLSIEGGVITVLFGPNGAGKTTLIRILCTLSRPTSGELTMDGLEVSHNGREIRARIGAVLHEPLLYDDLTAAENLRFYCRMYGAPISRVNELLELFRLKHRRNDRIATLSSGMIKRLALARAMIHDPDILILDEPFSSLDSDSVSQLIDLLNHLRDQGKTIVLATHHLKEGFEVAERLVVMKKGRIARDMMKAGTSAYEFESNYSKLTEAGS